MVIMYSKLVIVLCFVYVSYVDSARILGVFFFPSYSHQIVYEEVMKELVRRGHEITLITPNPIRESDIQIDQIDVSFVYEVWKRRKNMTKLDGTSSPKQVLSTDLTLLTTISQMILTQPKVIKLLKSNATSFDLVMTEWLHPALFAFSVKFKCPHIGIQSCELLDVMRSAIGNPTNAAVYPNFFLPYAGQLTLWERVASLDFSVWLRYYYHYDLLPKCNQLIRQYIGEDMPPVEGIIQNVSMVFVNTNPLFAKPIANAPNLIEFSGLHIKKPKPLPPHIQLFLDDAREGVVYCSLGTNIKSDVLSPELKQVFVETFKDLPYKVLWKFDEPLLNDTYDKIRIYKWLPQQDILAHPNVKVFITQGGVQSLDEAIRNRVPLVGMPFAIDQPKNMNKMVKLGIGLAVDKFDLTKEEFKATILEVAENQKYHRTIEELSVLLDDEPMRPLDKVVWWTEYVIRHKGAYHLRSPCGAIPWYQYFFLDILGFGLLCLILIAYAITYSRTILARFAKFKVD